MRKLLTKFFEYAKRHYSNPSEDTVEFFMRTLSLSPSETVVELRRQAGNTTRQVDDAIQRLFAGESIRAIDHWKFGSSEEANTNYFRRILLRIEHEHSWLIRSNLLEIDEIELTIKLHN